MRCGQRHGAPVRSAPPPATECEYGEVWTCEQGFLVLPITTGSPPPVFQMRFNQQEGVLVVARARIQRTRVRRSHDGSNDDTPDSSSNTISAFWRLAVFRRGQR